jgi:hypothetical protein
MLTNGMESSVSSDVFWIFFLGVLSHGSLFTVALAVASVDGREVRALPC